VIRLPIDVVPNTDPPRFRWRQLVGGFSGPQSLDHEGALPLTVEQAVLKLVQMNKRLLRENTSLSKQLDAANRRANAAETLCSNQKQMIEEMRNPPVAKKGK
jgi:hypothetical protein